MGTFIATIFKVRAHAVEIAAHPWNALLCVIALRSSRVRLHGCGIAQMAHGGAPVRTCKEGEQSATHELTVDRHDSVVSTAEERTIPRLVQPAHLLQELLHLRSVQRCANHHCFAAGTRGKHSAQSRGAAPAAHV